jgi:hypothetical protein
MGVVGEFGDRSLEFAGDAEVVVDADLFNVWVVG